MENKNIQIALEEKSKLSFLNSGKKVCISFLTNKTFVVKDFSAVTVDLEKDLSPESKDLFLKFLESLDNK